MSPTSFGSRLVRPIAKLEKFVRYQFGIVIQLSTYPSLTLSCQFLVGSGAVRFTMSAVTVEIFQQVTQNTDLRVTGMATRLESLFGIVEKRFSEHQNAMTKTEEKINLVVTEVEKMKLTLEERESQLEGNRIEVPQRLADIMEQTKHWPT